jgi:hypothetical protein
MSSETEFWEHHNGVSRGVALETATEPAQRWTQKSLLALIFTNVFTLRFLTAWILLTGVARIFDFTIWACPVYSTLEVKCPGCGLTRAVEALLWGNWAEAMELHLFAFPALVAAIGTLIVTFASPSLRDRLLNPILAIDQRLALGWVLLALFFLHWMMNLCTAS